MNKISDYNTIKLCLLIDTYRVYHDHMTESRESSTGEGSGLGNNSKSMQFHEKPLKQFVCSFVSVVEVGSTEMGPERHNAAAGANTLDHNQQNDMHQ